MDDLKYIKKHYGENMMHLCRTLFPSILEEKGILLDIMKSSFHSSKELYYDLIDYNLVRTFELFVLDKYNANWNELVETNKTPFELIKEANYDLYECDSEEQIQSFKKYYSENEELCTFRGDRLKTCLVFFAVKKGADKLDRKEFSNPKREDEYGTSVISIQFSRNNYNLSIKNRYNHTVTNPDATFNNNLENIIPGLTKSFEKYFNHSINYNKYDRFGIPNYIIYKNKFYKYNHEIDGIFYCTDNIVIAHGKFIEYPKEKYILADYYTIDLKNKEISIYDSKIEDAFVDEYKNAIDKINVEVDKENRIITIIKKDGNKSRLVLNKCNQIIEYENNYLKDIKYGFMHLCNYIEVLKLPNVENIERFSFTESGRIENLYLPSVKYIDSVCFSHCTFLKTINMPNLLEIENNCFNYCPKLTELNMPKVERIYYECFKDASALTKIYLPSVEYIGAESFSCVRGAKEIDLPSLERMDHNCFHTCLLAEKISCSKLRILESNCFKHVGSIEELNMPLLEIMRGNSFVYGKRLGKLYLSMLKIMYYNCFERFEKIDEVNLPKATLVAPTCFKFTDIKSANLPSLVDNSNKKLNKIKRKYKQVNHNFRFIPKNLVDIFKKMIKYEEKGICKTLKR